MLVGLLAALALYAAIALVWLLGWSGVLVLAIIVLALLYVVVPDRPFT
jgi:hypothetical protein